MQPSFAKKLEDNVGFFCRTKPKEDLVEVVYPLLQSDRVVIVYDPYSEVYAEIASWPLIMFGFNVSVVDSHNALYYYAPYTSESTSYIYFTDDLEGSFGIQLESTLRIMGYNRVFLSYKEARGNEAFSFTYGRDGRSILYGVKNVSYAFTKAVYRKTKNLRLSRVLENLQVGESQLLEYLTKALEYAGDLQASIIASQGPLLTVAKIATLLNEKIRAMPITRLLSLTGGVGDVEIWGLDVDSELIARVRFEKGSPKRVIHFGFDPLSSALASPYAVAYAEDFQTNMENTAGRNE